MTASQIPLGLAQPHRNQQLFADHYLNTVLPARPEWQALRAPAAQAQTAIREIFDTFTPSANEAQTEEHLIKPVLAALGHTIEVQAALRTPRGTRKPDYIFYWDAAARAANKDQVLTADLVRGSTELDRSTQCLLGARKHDQRTAIVATGSSMPEGPTIRHTADLLRDTLEGQQITRFHSPLKKAIAEGWADKISGQSVSTVRSHGKNLFIDFANSWTLYTHMMMWGAWHVYAHGEPWRREARKARVVLETATHCAVLFSAPVCQFIHASELATHPTSELGPDLLSATFGPNERAEVRRRLEAQGETAIGEVIMNQTVMAGIGNILKSEILFTAHIHPQRSAASLNDAEFERLITTSQDMMQRAYDTNSFIHVFLSPALRQATGSLGYVYGRSGQVCLRCGGAIAMVRQEPMQRMTFFCSFCQPLDPAHPPAREEATTQTPYTNTVHTLEEARDFVLTVGLCRVLHDPKGKLPTLWDALAFTRAGPDAWGEKLAQVWALRQRLVETYPEQIFSGKIRGGHIVLMSMERLRQEYTRYHRSIETCSELALQLYASIAQGPIASVPLRQAAGLLTRKDRGRFERALQELQSTFNIARIPASDSADSWEPFVQRYPQFAA